MFVAVGSQGERIPPVQELSDSTVVVVYRNVIAWADTLRFSIWFW
jgi:hypothetical protein